MRTVTVNTAKPYVIRIGSGILNTVGAEIAALGKVQKICIVSDDNVFPLYGLRISNLLEQSGFETHSFVFPAGEMMKNGTIYLSLLNSLANMQLTRSDLIIALGGGVVGDLAGFAAATYLRGIRYVQIPSTVLAAVDSSVGGKTAIDLEAGKNLAGAFHQPSLVLCDTDLLASLPHSVFRDGCAEIIKYGILYDEVLFSYLEDKGFSFDTEYVIQRCVELKRDAVVADELDTGIRMKLNLGHTIGHGVEAGSHFTISHGQAVAIGTAIVCRATGCPDTERIISLLKKFHLPTETVFSAEDLFQYTLSDKKRSGMEISLVIPEQIGKCSIISKPITQLKSFIQAGL